MVRVVVCTGVLLFQPQPRQAWSQTKVLRTALMEAFKTAAPIFVSCFRPLFSFRIGFACDGSATIAALLAGQSSPLSLREGGTLRWYLQRGPP